MWGGATPNRPPPPPPSPAVPGSRLRRHSFRGVDHPAAEALLAVVEHRVLAGGRRPLGAIEVDLQGGVPAAFARTDGACLIGLPVPNLRRAPQRQGRRAAGDPVHVAHPQPA